MYEYMSFSAGIRNLDQPHVAPQPLSTTPFPPDLLPPTPCNSETCVGPNDGVSDASVSSVLSATESNGLVMPVGWSMIDTGEAGTDTVIIPPAPTSLSTPLDESSGASSALTVILLDSDDDSVDSSTLVNNSVTSVRSSHSSDVYYADKRYDAAFAAFIEEEDSNAVDVVENLSANVS